MVKDKPKFDFAISNPPYQKLLSGATITSIYPEFILNASKVSERSTMVHPARAFKGAGRNSKEDVEAIMSDNRFGVVENLSNASEIFPSIGLKGGLIITDFNMLEPSKNGFDGLVSKELDLVSKKVWSKEGYSITESIHSYNNNKISEQAREELKDQMIGTPNKENFKTNIFSTLPFMFDFHNYGEEYDTQNNSLIEVLGAVNGKRKIGLIKKEYVEASSEWFGKWKVFLPAANGAGKFGEKLSKPVVGGPNMITTQTFITFGMFNTEVEANNCEKYLKTKFMRTLLAQLKTTQHNAKNTWKFVPDQDYSDNSHIDWSKSIEEIDEQLFNHYGLDDTEKQWIRDNVQEID